MRGAAERRQKRLPPLGGFWLTGRNLSQGLTPLAIDGTAIRPQ